MKTRALNSRKPPAAYSPGRRPPVQMSLEEEVREAIQRIDDNWPLIGNIAGPGWRVYPVPSEPGRLVRVEYYLDDLEGAGS